MQQIKEIADTNKDAIGFVLRPALLKAIRRHEIFVAVARNGRVLGFVNYHHRRDAQTTIYEICVKEAYRQRGIGQRLVEAVQVESYVNGKEFLQVKCPATLDANRFYAALGFQIMANEPGKKRELHIWQIPVAR